MKTKIFVLGFILLFAGACSAPDYVPSSKNIDINEYGSYIKLWHKSGDNLHGELIAIDSNEIIVLSEVTDTCVVFSLTEVDKFMLEYAHPKQYGWAIPLFTVSTFSHGYFLVFTAPVNLIVTIAVTATGARAFKFDDDDMTYEELKMFARFPQGIPAGVDLDDINRQ